jgi:rubrerythrin
MLLSKIWDLIRDEAEAVQGYYDVLNKAREEENIKYRPLVELIELIIADERDHAAALNLVYEALSENKIATDAQDLARRALSKVKAAQIYKESREESKEGE